MKKKLLILVLAVISCIACFVGVTACSTKPSDGGNNTEITTPSDGGNQGTVQTPPEEKPTDNQGTVQPEPKPEEKPTDNQDTVKPKPADKPSTVAVTGVTLNKTALSLEVGDNETLTATVAPNNATDKTVTWQSSDSSVVTVANGKVMAVAVGSTNITVKSNNNKIAVCAVTVTDPYKDFAFQQVGNAYTLTAYLGTDKNITVPATYKGKSVTVIGEKAFYECSQITKITLPDSIKEIGKEAFSYCASLQTINFPCTRILESAFANCTSLQKIVIPDNVQSIGISAFNGCTGLTNITLPFIGESATSNYAWFGYIFGAKNPVNNATCVPASLKFVCITGGGTVGNGAFYMCGNLLSIELPKSVTQLGYSVFEGCGNLISIELPESVTQLGSNVFKGCSSLVNLTVPFIPEPTYSTTSEYRRFLGVLFGAHKYEENKDYVPASLKSVTVFKGVIDGYAFYDCSSLESVIIGNGATSIGDWTFYGCSSLTSVTIGDGVTSIGIAAFYSCSSLESVTIGDGVASIGKTAFYGCGKLDNVYIASLSKWCHIVFGSKDAFESEIRTANPLNYARKLYCNNQLIKDLIIPADVTIIKAYTFEYASFTSIIVPDTVKTIEDGAFYRCSQLKKIQLPFVGKNINSAYKFGSIFGSSTATENYTFLNEHYGGTFLGYDNLLTYQNDLYVSCNTYKSSLGTVYQVTYRGYYIPKTLTEVTITTSNNLQSDSFYNCIYLTTITINGSDIHSFTNCNAKVINI